MTTPRISGHFVLGLLAALVFATACEKKPTTSDTSTPSSGGTGSTTTPGKTGSGSSATATPPSSAQPIAGYELKLDGDKATLFYKLVDSLKSPCGKAESLRQSFTSGCKRAPFALRYLTALLEDEATEDQARDEYHKKYEDNQTFQIDVSKAPRVGLPDAPIRIVEFFDYECPHCQRFKPMLDAVAQKYEGKTVEYYMMFPLHAESKSAAQAAVAAQQLGHFREMHDLLFVKSPAHSHEDVVGYAKDIGLDPAKFEAAYQAAATRVDADQDLGRGAGVNSTPTVFFNDRKYEGPLNARYLGLWIEEELAVNR